MSTYTVDKISYGGDTYKIAKNIWYATCPTGASTAAKVVTTSSGDFVLETGAMVRVTFTNGNSYNGTATLNVDGTGATDIVRVGTTKTTRYYWVSGETVDFVYDGTNFAMSDKGTATTTYYGLTKLVDSTSSTSTSLAATGASVKAAYDLANGKVSDVEVNSSSVVTSGVASLTVPTNLENGSMTGSLRGISTNAEGSTYTMGYYALAVGDDTEASGTCSFAGGVSTVASGNYSIAQNYFTTAQRKSQTTIGEYNILDTGGTDTTTRGDYALIVGNGTASNSRSNAMTLGWDGNIRIALMNSIAYPVDLELYMAIDDLGWTSEVID